MGANENLTIVFTDIVGYTELTARQSRSESMAMLQRHDQVLLPIVKAYEGRRIKTIGDAMLLVFRSPTDAVHCGMAMQDALANLRSKTAGQDQIHIRVAINLGEVRLERNDVYGEPVNIAARLEGMTPADEVWFTEAVYLAMNKAEVPSESVGEHSLKGIPDPIRAYRVPPYKLTRLIGAGEEVSDQPALPFDGAHLRRRPAPSAGQLIARPIGKIKRSVVSQVDRWTSAKTSGEAASETTRPARTHFNRRMALLCVLLALTVILHLQWNESPKLERAAENIVSNNAESSSAQWLKQAESALESGDLDSLEMLLEQHSAEPAADLVRGHLAFGNQQIDTGISRYADAFAASPQLAQNSRAANNLVRSLAKSESAALLLQQYASVEMRDALAWYSGQPGYYRRKQVIELLKAIGAADRINWFGHYVEELQGRSRCEDRVAAIQGLRDLGDPNAIAPIQKAMGEGLRGWWQNRCLRDQAEDAIRALKNG